MSHFQRIFQIFISSVLGSSDGSPRECPDFFEKSRKIKIPSFSGFFLGSLSDPIKEPKKRT